MKIEGQPPQPQEPLGSKLEGGPTGAVSGKTHSDEYGGTKAIQKFYQQAVGDSLQKETDLSPEQIKAWMKQAGVQPTPKLKELLAKASAGQPLSGDDLKKVTKEVGVSVYNTQMISIMKGMLTQLQQHESARAAREAEMKQASPS